MVNAFPPPLQSARVTGGTMLPLAGLGRDTLLHEPPLLLETINGEL